MTTTSVTFRDERTMNLGDRVRFSSRYGSTGWGTIVGFVQTKRDITIQVEADADTKWGRYDRWPLKSGNGEYNRLSQDGLYGGEIYEVVAAIPSADLEAARRSIVIENAVRADERVYRDDYKTLRGYIRGAVKRLAFYEITAEDVASVVTW